MLELLESVLLQLDCRSRVYIYKFFWLQFLYAIIQSFLIFFLLLLFHAHARKHNM